jgi:maleate cis-trans isomerase
LTEPLFGMLLPEGITSHTSRMARCGPIDLDNMKQMNEQFDTALNLLPLPYLDLVVYHCTMGGLIYGPDRLLRDIEERTGLRAVTTMQSALDALSAFGARSITLVTPYQQSFNEMQKAFFEQNGITVLAVGGEAFVESGIVQHLSPEEVSLWIRRSRKAGSDAVFMSCTGIRSMEFIDELEQDLGIPVVTSTSAVIWQVLKRLDLNLAVPGLGALLNGSI